MPTMSLDFSITQIYRLVANDLLMMADAYAFYRKYKKTGRTLKEFMKVLVNLVDVESENFEEIKNIGKMSYGEDHELSTIIWDYFHDVVMKHVLDDISQYPFWAAKIAVTTRAQVFGLPVIYSWIDTLQATYLERGSRGLFQGLLPYLAASGIINYQYVWRMTSKFVTAVMAKIPHTTSVARLESEANSATIVSKPGSQLSLVYGSGQPIGANTSSPKKRRGSKKGVEEKQSWIMKTASNAVVAFLSHPFLVVSVNMVTNPALQGLYSIGAYFKILQTSGVRGVYWGVKTRIILSLIPLSPLFLFGVTDNIMYRRMLGQGSRDLSGGLSSVLREIAPKEGGGVTSLLNYGLITLVQVVPGFLSFVVVRGLSMFVFGSSLQRRHQISRRKEIIESHLATMTKKFEKSEAANTNSNNGTPNPSNNLTMSPPGEISPMTTSGKMTKSKSAHFNI